MKLSLLVITIVLTGCLKTRSDIAQTEERRQGQISTQPAAPSPASAPASAPTYGVPVVVNPKAEQEARLQDIEATLRTLNGRIEALEYRQNQQLEQAQKPQGPSKEEEILQQLKIFQDNFDRIEMRMTELEKNKSTVPTTAKPTTATAATTIPAAKKETSSDWDEAEKLFETKEWKKAILSYQKYRDQNPNGKNWDLATYKIGVSFQELGRPSDAKVFYEEVIEKFPKSSAARKATYRLKTLK